MIGYVYVAGHCYETVVGIGIVEYGVLGVTIFNVELTCGGRGTPSNGVANEHRSYPATSKPDFKAVCQHLVIGVEGSVVVPTHWLVSRCRSSDVWSEGTERKA